MKINAELLNKISKKGNAYTCIEIQLTDKYKKVVFLDEPESALVQVAYPNLNERGNGQ